MTEQEIINMNVQRQIDAQNARIDNVLTKVDSVISEIRDRDNQRAAEIIELRKKQDAAQAQHNADMKELREDIKNSLKHIQGLTIASMVGIAAIAVGVLGFLWSTARNMEPPPTPPAQTAQIPAK